MQTPIAATSIEATLGQTIYPEPYASKVKGRLKRKLGDRFGLTNFGVNLTHLSPSAMSGLRHSHTKQDEFIYILAGHPTLIIGEETFLLNPGECYGYKAGTGIAHHLVNRSTETVTYIEVGDRTPGDTVEYPDDDLTAIQSVGWTVAHKDGRPY
jgi:uncharacterized cupin superfamily protein